MDSVDKILAQYFCNYLEREFTFHPIRATLLGDHRFDHLLDDYSVETRSCWQAHTQMTLEGLPQAVNFSQLSVAGQIDYHIFADDLTRRLWVEQQERPYETDPRIYTNSIAESIYHLFTQSAVNKTANVRNAIARMSSAPALLAIAQQRLEKPALILTKMASEQNQGAMTFFTTDLFDIVGETELLTELKEAAGKLVSALMSHQRFLDDDLMARSTGQWRTGKAHFAQKIELQLAPGKSVDVLASEAQAELGRVRGEMAAIASHLWTKYYPERAQPHNDDIGRQTMVADILSAIGHDHGQASDLSRDAAATCAGLKAFINERQLIGLPDPDVLNVIDMPLFQRGNTVAYLCSAPPLDTKAESFYAISPPPNSWGSKRVESYLQEYNRYMLQVLSIHEAYPGHHVQLNRANCLPSLIRKILGSEVYIEGWAVYCEQMMLDAGYGKGDLALRLTQYKFYLRAITNALLDYGLHCSGMNDEEAKQLLVQGAFQSESEAALKLVRAKMSSGQLSTYFVGRMAMMQLREKIEMALGEKFNLGQFHEAIISQGAVPVRFLPLLVEQHLSSENPMAFNSPRRNEETAK